MNIFLYLFFSWIRQARQLKTLSACTDLQKKYSFGDPVPLILAAKKDIAGRHQVHNDFYDFYFRSEEGGGGGEKDTYVDFISMK
jgi:hypothetical protein